MDNADTQVESQLSPIGTMRDLNSPAALQVVASTGSSTDLEEESAEEEERASDECVEPIENHEDVTYVIESDDECVLSPKKQTPQIPLPPHDTGSAGSARPADNTLATAIYDENGEVHPFLLEKGLEVAQTEKEVESIQDSDDEKKGVYKDLLFSVWFLHRMLQYLPTGQRS